MSPSISFTPWSIRGCAMTDVVFAAPPTQVLAERRRFRVLRKLAAHRSFKIGLVRAGHPHACALWRPAVAVDRAFRGAGLGHLRRLDRGGGGVFPRARSVC